MSIIKDAKDMVNAFKKSGVDYKTDSIVGVTHWNTPDSIFPETKKSFEQLNFYVKKRIK